MNGRLVRLLPWITSLLTAEAEHGASKSALPPSARADGQMKVGSSSSKETLGAANQGGKKTIQ